MGVLGQHIGMKGKHVACERQACYLEKEMLAVKRMKGSHFPCQSVYWCKRTPYKKENGNLQQDSSRDDKCIAQVIHRPELRACV